MESDQTPSASQHGIDQATSQAAPPATTTTQEPPKSWDVEAKKPGDETTRSNLETALVIVALCLALFLAALDTTIVTTAIPTIAHEFNSSAGYVWVGSAYLLGNASFVPLWGKLSDIFGRKYTLLATIAVFWVGSLLCAVSVSMPMLIAARAIQGVGSGGAIVLPNICISDLFSARERSMYFAIFGVVWAVAGAIGPVLGGVFTTKVTWRWCFYVNLPISGVAMIILIVWLRIHNPHTPLREGLLAIDWVGSLLIVGGTLMLLLGLGFGGVQYAWDSATVICLIVFGVVTMGIFAVYEAKVAKFPIFRMALLSDRTSLASLAVCFWHAFTFIGGTFWLPLYFQAILSQSSLMSGVYLLPFALFLSLSSTITGITISKTGHYKTQILVGALLMTLGFGLMTDLGSERNFAKTIVFLLIAGLGVGPNFQAPLIALQSNVAPRDIGSATSCFGFVRQIGTSMSVVIGGVIFNNQMENQFPTLERELGKNAFAFSGANAAANALVAGELQGHEATVVHEAYWISLRGLFILFTCTAFITFLFALGIRQKELSKQHQEHKTGLQSLKPAEGKEKEGEAAK